MFCLPPKVNKSDDGLVGSHNRTSNRVLKYDWLMAKIVALFSSLFFTG